MNDIDRYLDQACHQITGPDSLRAHLRKELKEHLEEAIDAMVAEGMTRDDATVKAIEDLGAPEAIRVCPGVGHQGSSWANGSSGSLCLRLGDDPIRRKALIKRILEHRQKRAFRR